MNKDKFEKDMEVFSFGQHQDVLTYLNHLKSKGWTIEDAKNWIEEQQKSIVKQQKLYEARPKCPECQQPLRGFPVNTEPGNQTGDSTDKSMWLCPNPECMHTIYNKQTLKELSQSSEEV